MNANDSFDYIIVGGGAAGTILANRLSADLGRSVLLLEAGPADTNPDIADPARFIRLWGSDLDWKLETEPQPGLNNRKIIINQGRVLGGGASLNAMMYVRGNRANFDQWNARGADGWSYADLLPYFKKVEDFEGGASEYHGVGGPIRIRECPDDAMRSEPFMYAAKELGYDGPYWDYNGARQENGAGLLQFHTRQDGLRSNPTSAYLDPVRSRPNLTVLTGAEARRVLLTGKRATGIEFVQNGAARSVRATREVVLCASTFLSPKLLLLSGIGPADELRGLGINVVADLPGVGKNLQDHMQLSSVFRSKVDHPQPTLLSGNILFVKTRPGMGAAAPDLQLNFTPAVPKPLAPFLDFGGPACIFLAIMTQPFSRGEVTLRSADPAAVLRINPNYLSCDADVQVFRSAMKLIRDMAGTKAFAGINGGEIAPGAADLDGFIRSQASTIWHPAGTCRVGRDAHAVVDPQLRVHGIEGLRVADASIMPTVTTGNTVAACFVIAEKAADMILAS